jgi:hypothetical protein
MGKKTPDPQLGKQVTAGYQETAPQLQWQDNHRVCSLEHQSLRPLTENSEKIQNAGRIQTTAQQQRGAC